MKSSSSEIPEELAKAVEFHGHLCPGVVIGYLAATVAMERLGAKRSEDEELVAIVENDSCAVDAVQALTGCTLGKGNLFLRNYGKMVFTLALRPSGQSVRLCLKPTTQATDRPVPEDPDKLRQEKIQYMLSRPPSEFFSIRQEIIGLPEKAQIRRSAICDICGESVMETKTRTVSGVVACIPCARNAQMQNPE